MKKPKVKNKVVPKGNYQADVRSFLSRGDKKVFVSAAPKYLAQLVTRHHLLNPLEEVSVSHRSVL